MRSNQGKAAHPAPPATAHNLSYTKSESLSRSQMSSNEDTFSKEEGLLNFRLTQCVYSTFLAEN